MKNLFFLYNILQAILFYSVCGYLSPTFAQENNLLNKKGQMKVLKKIDKLLEAKYVLPEKAKQCAEEFRKHYQRGDFQSLSDPKGFAEQVTADLVRITKDKHVNFRVIEASDIGEKAESSLHHPVRYHRLGIKENKGFSKLEWLDGNIGYLDLRRFYYHADIKDFINGAMKFLSNANAIIIDLRENGGGSGDYLSSYFLDYPTQLNSCYSREDDFLTEFWTTKDIGMQPLTEVPIFLITGKKTFSAAESFAYDMKVRERAVLIGDSTKGGAHSVDLYRIDDQFEIYIPTARAVNPITGTNWEGTGVIPDILVPSESALDTAIVLAKKAGAEFAKVRDAELKLAVEKMQVLMDRTETLFQDNKNEEAVAALDSVFRIADKQGLVNCFFIDVLAYNYFSHRNKHILYAILKKKIELFPKDPAAYKSLAWAYYMNGKKEKAVEYYQYVLKLDPDDRNAVKMIRRIQSE